MGVRAAVSGHVGIPVDVSGYDTQGVELPPEPVLSIKMDSNAQVGGYMPAWGALLPLNGSGYQAAGRRVDDCER